MKILPINKELVAATSSSSSKGSIQIVLWSHGHEGNHFLYTELIDYTFRTWREKIWHLKCEQTKKILELASTRRTFRCICCHRCTAAPLCGPSWSQTLWGRQQDQIWQPHALIWIFFFYFMLTLLCNVQLAYMWLVTVLLNVTEIILIVSICKLKDLCIFPLLKNIQWENIWSVQLMLFSQADWSTWFSAFFSGIRISVFLVLVLKWSISFLLMHLPSVHHSAKYCVGKLKTVSAHHLHILWII